MKSLRSLFHDVLFPNTRVYQDSEGNFRGTSTDVTSWYLLIGRLWGGLLWLYIILTPLLGPVYFIFAHWYCRRYDAENKKEDPIGWPHEKRQILKYHRNILIGWIIFMVWGYCVDWGIESSASYNNVPTSTTNVTSTWDPYNYEDPYGQYNHYK